MAWCRQATSHYLNQCWSRSMSPSGVTRPQWVTQEINTKITQKWVHKHFVRTIHTLLDGFVPWSYHSFTLSHQLCFFTWYMYNEQFENNATLGSLYLYHDVVFHSLYYCFVGDITMGHAVHYGTNWLWHRHLKMISNSSAITSIHSDINGCSHKVSFVQSNQDALTSWIRDIYDLLFCE